MSRLNIKCPYCGSEDVEQINDNEFICLCCDSRFDNNHEDKKIIVKEKVMVEHNPFDLVNLFKENVRSCIEITTEFNDFIKTGSGVIIDGKHVITNAHVVSNKHFVSKFITGNFYKNNLNLDLKVVRIDYKNDLALLEVLNFSFKDYKDLRNVEIQIGEKMFAITNSESQGLALTDGIISESSRYVDNNELIVFTAPINHGSSGGPVFNYNGDLIAIVVSYYKDSNGIYYGIPIKKVIDFMR